MDTTKSATNNPFGPSRLPNNPNLKDEWEEWEDSDDEGLVAMEDKDGLLIDLAGETTEKSAKPTNTQSILRNTSRHSVQRPVRVKSRGRQKAQNARVGIKLVTDMSTFRRPVKFVDPTALHALEGEPTSASIGSFSWLKKKPGNALGSKPINKHLLDPSPSDLSPAARPIVIGISLPSDNLSDYQASPQTANIETPIDLQGRFPLKSTTNTGNPTAPTPQQLRSVWSPDTEASQSPYPNSRAASSVYSQPSMYGGPVVDTDIPPVPALPATVQPKQKQTIRAENFDDDDDIGTPCTLFEEDGSPTMTRKSLKPKVAVVSPESASSRSHGWWDHVTTPFLQQSNPFKQQPQETGSSSSPQQWNPFKKQTQEAGSSASQPAAVPQEWLVIGDEKGSTSQSNPSDEPAKMPSNNLPVPEVPHEWWNGTDEKRAPSSEPTGLAISTPAAPQQQHTIQSVGTSSRSASPGRRETQSDKARILLEENHRPSEEPPPYSPPKPVNYVKYGVVLPPTQVIVNTARVPSPGPMTPGLPGTMTSQGAINMAEIPLTPAGPRPAPAVVLPDRAPGTFITGDHFYEARGQTNKTERQRRRHEKEEVVARKVGGFWRGRGCMPKDGCFGRSGREGRKRRRIWLAVIGGIIAAIILAVVLAVVLTQRHPGESPAPFSIWLNLTDFPPMPTGVLTVSGPENSEARTGCFLRTADTAWSCSLPKEEHDSVAPHEPDQPEFIFQIQYDNNTRALWKVADDNETSSGSQQTFLTDEGFSPDPQPPSIAEMRFLGNTTDHIEADNKAGEATPFFISVLETVNKTVGPNMLRRRQGPNNSIGTTDGGGFNLTEILPPPTLNGDGTGATARMFPRPVQQPVRLFDRGLPTEHYGFYTYFDKTIYLVDTVNANAADNGGGAPLAEAKSLVTFAQTRFLVQIWTRMENTTRLLGNGSGGGDGGAVPWTNGTASADTPGTMPYPVTVTEDMHGGDRNKKIDFVYGVLQPSRAVNTTDAQLIIADRGFAGTLVNGMGDDPDLSLGGVDGGTGGCRCEWVNFQGLNKATTTR
ncbi:hypothetical protein F4820DRAFT_419960 [Hypoxylon rubiginosum]|uniref:Uncharacterized protein n=1 Tax=Hypoxylon rubiginosum TaxID=110542 RepID=A0ACB9Z2I6_9PEZI|nr:hypothetical protein F4820DRAFT_419960 [Hypoxylon rubiginosum]